MLLCGSLTALRRADSVRLQPTHRITQVPQARADLATSTSVLAPEGGLQGEGERLLLESLAGGPFTRVKFPLSLLHL